MNDRNFDQLLNAWMDLGPTTAPERVADAARLEAVATRQVPAIVSRWAPRRFPFMNTTAKVTLATAAVVLAVVLGYNYLVAPSVGGPRLFAPDQTPTPSPSPSPAAVDFTQHPGEGRALQPGSYRIDYSAPVEVIITVPDKLSGSDPSAWYKAMFDWGPWHQSNTARLGFGDIENLRVDACDPGPGWQDPAVGPGVADLVTGLSAIPIIDVTRSESTLDGYSGQLLEITGTEPPAGCSDAPILWETTRGDESLVPGPGERMRVWVLDVEGNRLVIWAGQDTDDQATADDLQALIDSIRIQAP
jgi:hypothetical protein